MDYITEVGRLTTDREFSSRKPSRAGLRSADYAKFLLKTPDPKAHFNMSGLSVHSNNPVRPPPENRTPHFFLIFNGSPSRLFAPE
jgi:hypothetical protein